MSQSSNKYANQMCNNAMTSCELNEIVQCVLSLNASSIQMKYTVID